MVAKLLVITLEKGRKWSTWLRSELTSEKSLAKLDIDLVSCVAFSDCVELLNTSNASLVVLEATEKNQNETVDFMMSATVDYPNARLVVVADRSLVEWQLSWRAAGAIFVAFGYDQLVQLASMAKRYAQHVPEPQVEYRQRISNQIPW